MKCTRIVVKVDDLRLEDSVDFPIRVSGWYVVEYDRRDDGEYYFLDNAVIRAGDSSHSKKGKSRYPVEVGKYRRELAFRGYVVEAKKGTREFTEIRQIDLIEGIEELVEGDKRLLGE